MLVKKCFVHKIGENIIYTITNFMVFYFITYIHIYGIMECCKAKGNKWLLKDDKQHNID